MTHLFLSRRNLLTLLSKLDRVKEGDTSACTLIKPKNIHEKYPHPGFRITAVEDADYYTERCAGEVHPSDEARIRA